MEPSRTELSQRVLALELRYAIDDAQRTGRTTQIARLLDENPHGSRSSHVRHNLGRGRVRWLKAFREGWDR
jgi:hypothetical protein